MIRAWALAVLLLAGCAPAVVPSAAFVPLGTPRAPAAPLAQATDWRDAAAQLELTASAVRAQQTQIASLGTREASYALATSLAIGQAREAAAIEATRTAQALAVEQDRDSRTATALAASWQATRAAQAYDATATRSAALEASTAAAYATAQVLRGEQIQRDRETARVWAQASGLMALGVSLASAALLIGLALAGVWWALEQARRAGTERELVEADLKRARAETDRLRIVEGRAHTYLLTADGVEVLASAPPGTAADPFASDAQPTLPAPPLVVRSGGRVTVYPPAGTPLSGDPRRRLVLKLLRDAIAVTHDPGSTRIPGQRELSWHPQPWTEAVAALRPHAVTTVGRSGGTVLVGYTLGSLYYAVGSRHLALAPLSASPGPAR